jgi:protoheme IX farnesyltransferase
MIYSLLFVPCAIAPAFTGLGGAAYAAVSGLGGLMFLVLAFKLWRSRAGEIENGDARTDDGLYGVKADAKDARNLFAFSILYLTLLFATLLAEHAIAAFGGR